MANALLKYPRVFLCTTHSLFMPRPIKNNRTGTPTEATKHLQNKILEMKRDGMSFIAIAAELDYSDTYIKKLYRQALKAIIVDNVEDVRKMELLKLEALEKEAIEVLRSFHPVVSSGNVVRDYVDGEDGKPLIDPETGAPVTARLRDMGPKLAAIDRAVKIMERRAKLLGLESALKQEITVEEKDADLSHLTLKEKVALREKIYKASKGFSSESS